MQKKMHICLVICRKMYNFAADLNKYTSDES
jgi:hypothetical protein